jgi:uncharacterized protein YecT (DUF1311 family)
VEQNDRALTSTYERLIGDLRHRANTKPSDPDPRSVDSLRRAQQRWQESRESTCRGVGSAPLFARARARCYAEIGAKRTSDLSSRLGSASATPKDSARP